MKKLRIAAAAVAALFAFAPAAHAQVSISNLPAATTPLAGSELSPLVQSGTTVKAAASALINQPTQAFVGLTFNKLTLTQPASSAVLTIANGKTFTSSNTLTLTAVDSSTLAIGAGGTLGTNAYTSTVYAPLASPTFTGVVTMPTPFTLGATSVTTTGTQLNYLNAATGTTGTASTNLVYSTSPTLITPTLGVASATSINKVALTAPASGSTLTIADGKTLTANNSGTLAGGDAFTLAIAAGKTLTVSKSLTLDGTDATTMTFPTTNATVARTDAAQSFTGVQTFLGQIVTGTGLPTIANGACGAGANGAVAADSTNQSGAITIGAAATTDCTIAFSATLGAAPKNCVIQPQNAQASLVATTTAYVSAITTAHFVITGTALASANYGYTCL